VAAKLDGAVLRPVLKIDPLQHRRCPVAVHFRADAPLLAEALRGASASLRPLQGAGEMRNAALDPDGAVHVADADTIDGIDEKPHFDGAVRGGAVGRDAKEIALAVDRDGAFALDGSEEGANLATESQPVEKERTARPVGKREATLFDGKVGDRDRVRIEGE